MKRGRATKGFTLIEMLVVVAIIGILSLAVVPFAEVSFIRLKETEFENNLRTVRQAIQQWRQDCEYALLRQLNDYDAVAAVPDCHFYPPDIGSLTKSLPFAIIGPSGTQVGWFYPKPYLAFIPADPFVGGPVWTQHYASATPTIATSTYEAGRITGTIGTGVFDISGHPETAKRRGFVTAIDGTPYSDW